MASPGGATGPALQVSEEKYSAGLANDAEGLRVVFKGTISTVNPASVLNPFVEAVHRHVAAAGSKEVRIDFTELEFCNSSGFKAFINWIQKVQAMEEPSRYRLRFLASATRKWQRTSLLALSCYAPSLVEIG
jgi:hypothetical protein